MQGYARFANIEGRRPVETVDLTTNPQAMRRGGVWFVVIEFDGRARAWRFAEVTRRVKTTPEKASPRLQRQPAGTGGAWVGPDAAQWSSSLDRDGYVAAVRSVRASIRDGEVYQANICRVLSAPLAATPEPDAAALADRLAEGNPAPFQGLVHVPASHCGTDGTLDPVWVVTASPELFLRIDGLTGLGPATITSGPIKGTAPTRAGLTAKDEAENIMITDLVRNDLQQVCKPGTVAVTDLLAVEHHPGLVHLVSTVTGTLRPALIAAPDFWGRVLAATFPPASVSGAPKSAALRIIDALETAPRGPYCGAIGWVDADVGTAELAVGIRTFWWEPSALTQAPTGSGERTSGTLRFGTGAGITWGSDPEAEWAETELKAKRLISLASGGD